jgi:hypothetical protein
MLTWVLAKKDLRVLVRDPRAVVVLLAMPLIFILVLGMSLGEGFGQKPDDRLRISLVDLDTGYPDPESEDTSKKLHWSKTVERDLAQTAGIRVEVIPTLEEAQELVSYNKRAAVLVFGPKFSERMTAQLVPHRRSQSSLSRRHRPGAARRLCAARPDAVDRGLDHRAGGASHDAPRGAPLDDRPGVREDRRPHGPRSAVHPQGHVPQLRLDGHHLGGPGPLAAAER